MSFLLDTDICSAYLRGNAAVFGRFIQHSGGLHISTITLGELYVWAYRAKAGPKRTYGIDELLRDVVVLEINADVARKFGEVRAHLLDSGTPAPGLDLQNAAVALVHDLTLVTHNTADYANVPGLRLADWLNP